MASSEGNSSEVSAQLTHPDLMGGPLQPSITCDGRTPTILCFHGFSSTPQEVELVVDVAGELGCQARAELLPGHGDSLETLAQSRWSDWRQSVEALLNTYASEEEPVIVAGLSTGALLALDLAACHPNKVLGVVALSPALRLTWPFPSLALQLYCGLRLPNFFLPKKFGPDIRDAAQRSHHVTHRAQPAYGGNEVRLAGKRVKKILRNVTCPVFVAHGAQDHVIPVSAGRDTFRLVGTPDEQKRLLILPRSYHIITRDVDRDLLRTQIHQFLQPLVTQARNSA